MDNGSGVHDRMSDWRSDGICRQQCGKGNNGIPDIGLDDLTGSEI
jgi:hypothetical protein